MALSEHWDITARRADGWSLNFNPHAFYLLPGCVQATSGGECGVVVDQIGCELPIDLERSCLKIMERCFSCSAGVLRFYGSMALTVLSQLLFLLV
jgi:hypothetical protein